MASESQKYQPLSFALQPFTTSQAQSQPSYGTQPTQPADVPSAEDDRNPSEEQSDGQSSNPDSPETQRHAVADPVAGPSNIHPSAPLKRKPGRPKGSKTKKRRIALPNTEPSFAASPSYIFPTNVLSPTTPIHDVPPEANTADYQFQDFQRKVLSLCANFYDAALQLVKTTPAAVISRAYALSNGRTNDPLTILTNAKRICDDLISNPSAALTSSMSPPTHPAPTFRTPVLGNAPTPSMQVFEIPLQRPPSTTTTSTSVAQASNSPVVSLSQFTLQPLGSPTLPNLHINQQQGQWSEEESERLRNLAEDYRMPDNTIDWDSAVNAFGPGRSRHQILIKATSMGLKPSSTRIPKRNRESQAAETAPSPSQSTAAQSANQPTLHQAPSGPTQHTPTSVHLPTANPGAMWPPQPPSHPHPHPHAPPGPPQGPPPSHPAHIPPQHTPYYGTQPSPRVMNPDERPFIWPHPPAPPPGPPPPPPQSVLQHQMHSLNGKSPQSSAAGSSAVFDHPFR